MSTKRILFAGFCITAFAAAGHAEGSDRSNLLIAVGWKIGTASKMPLTEGRVESVNIALGEVVIDHGDLPNLGMPPMTMGFAVSDKRMLKNLRRGTRVRFNAAIVRGEATVTYIESAP